MQNILIGLLVLLVAAGVVAAVFRPIRAPRHFIDADQDGEPDETPEEKRRALETDAD
ncbi:hypothetical protein BH10PSE1_BH10PSE1_11660 [soil metagenome]